MVAFPLRSTVQHRSANHTYMGKNETIFTAAMCILALAILCGMMWLAFSAPLA